MSKMKINSPKFGKLQRKDYFCKIEMVENMKEDITVEYEKIHGEKPKSFFVL